jgi:cobalt-precorrin 5A hydrolase
MKRLAVGIGCKRGASVEQIDAAVRAALGPHSIDEIHTIATIDVKAHEPGIVAFCARYGLPLRVFSREQIAAAGADATTTPSPAARAHLGVDGVCEPCARLAASGGQLIAPRQVRDGVTVAIAVPFAGTVAEATVPHALSLSHPQDLQ